MKRYQYNFSENYPQLYSPKSRVEKGVRLIKTLEDYLGKDKLKILTILTIGSSTGIIDNVLAKRFKKVIGIDIDKKAVEFAKKKFKRKNLTFRIGDAMKLDFKNNSLDVITCMQVYEHVPDDKRLMREIFRVLKPGGICYFAAGNRLWPWEYHYHLPFLTWLPKSLANIYIRVRGEKEYYESLRTYWGLKKIVGNKFKIVDYTPKILSAPQKYGYENKIPPLLSPLLTIFSPVLKFFVPSFFWILEK